MSETHCHVPVGGHAAQWTINEDGSWEATYGSARASDTADGGLEEARAAAEAWVATLHRAHTGRELPA